MEGRVLEGRAQSRVEETRKLGFSRAERGWAHHPAVFCTLCTYTCKSPPGRHTKRNRRWAGGLGDEADFAGLRHTGYSGGCVGCGAGLGLIAGPGASFKGACPNSTFPSPFSYEDHDNGLLLTTSMKVSLLSSPRHQYSYIQAHKYTHKH